MMSGCVETAPEEDADEFAYLLAFDASVELGKGLDAWTPFEEEEAAIDIVVGAQSGYHLELAVKLWGISPEGVALSFEVIDVEKNEVVSYPTREVLRGATTTCSAEGYCERTGIRVIFDLVSDPEDLVGKELLLRLNLQQNAETLYNAEQIARVTDVLW